MVKYIIRSSAECDEDTTRFGFVRGFSVTPAGGFVTILRTWSECLLFDSYAEACAVIAFIVAYVDETFEGYLSISSVDTNGNGGLL